MASTYLVKPMIGIKKDALIEKKINKAKEKYVKYTYQINTKLFTRIICGAKGIRTPDLFHAMEARYQLRHSPVRTS